MVAHPGPMSEAAYPRTPVGEIEVKRLPPHTAYEASGRADAFAERSELFSRNFAFLKRNHIAMTVPVEMDVERPAMRFYVPRSEEDAALERVPGVEVRRMDDRLVVSVGMRGGYSPERFDEGRSRAFAWMRVHPELEPTGPAEVAYWNGPMVPPFLRRFEVHVPVRVREHVTTPL